MSCFGYIEITIALGYIEISFGLPKLSSIWFRRINHNCFRTGGQTKT